MAVGRAGESRVKKRTGRIILRCAFKISVDSLYFVEAENLPKRHQRITDATRIAQAGVDGATSYTQGIDVIAVRKATARTAPKPAQGIVHHASLARVASDGLV